ncbi:MAG: cyclase family protein [Armatimonadetes bacterium]|nr:cyclase family protein [Armatimonadota bacterium]MDE2206304.1 cyclase family protein [Armatimonadota bacterium]
MIDLSQPIFDGGPNCPAHPPVRSEVVADHAAGGWRMELLTLASHTGSHLDAPLHKLRGGASISEMPLESFTGAARIADLVPLEPKTSILPEQLERAAPNLHADEILLVRTGWGEKRQRSNDWLFQSPKLSPAAANWLVEKQIRGLGIDHWGVGGWDPENDATVHTILLSHGIWIVEELRFTPQALAAGQPVTFMALPVNLQDHSGAWCRPVLLTDIVVSENG